VWYNKLEIIIIMNMRRSCCTVA